MILPAANSKLFARASLAVVGLMFVVPFLQPYHRNPIPSFYGEWLAFALGLAAALLLLRWELWRKPLLPKVALAPLVLVGLLGMQILLGSVALPEQALTAALYLIWTALLMVLGAALGRELGTVTITTVLAWSVLAGGLLNAVAGVIQHYHPSGALGPLVSPKFTVAVYGNIGQANHFANYIALALASTAYLYARGSLRAHWAAASGFFLLLVLALTGSRSPWLYLSAFVVLALMGPRVQGGESPGLLRYCLWLVLGFAAAQWIVTLPFLIPEKGMLVTSGERLFAMASGVDARLRLLREAWAIFVDSPLLGGGWGYFSWHHFQYQALTGAAAPGLFNHAHNLVLQLMAETGIVGALAVAAAALAWIRDQQWTALDFEHWWLIAMLSVLAIHSLLELPLWYSNFLGIAAVLLGAGARQFIGLKALSIAPTAVTAIIAIGCLNLAWVLAGYRDFERLLFERPKPAALAPNEPGATDAVMKVHRDPVLKYYVEVAVSSGIVLNEDQLRDKIELNSRVMRFAPGDLAVYRQALLLALADERGAALRQFEWAARVYPDRLPLATETIAALAQAHPERFSPLLELALARSERHREPEVAR